MQLPTHWGEVTTKQYQRMHSDWDSNDLVKLFSILTGIEYKTLSDTKDPDLEEALVGATMFVYDTSPGFKQADPPPFVTINKKKVRIPRNIGALSIGQNIHVREQMDSAKVFDELISFATAMYLQPLYDETDFDYVRATMLHEEILKLPISETYPVGFFLLRPLMNSGQSTTNGFSRTITRLLRKFTARGRV